MKRPIYALLLAQFLSAFADNAILFTAIAMILHKTVGAWYIPALQSAFLVAFVLLAPWVGPFADRRPKAVVLLIGNGLKAAGTGLMLVGVEPILAYALVGIGAAVYSPAKYGILPEIVSHDELVRANGWIEGSTIFAIIAGTVVGARIADASIIAALFTVVACYLLSVVATLFIPRGTPVVTSRAGLRDFVGKMRILFSADRARFAMLGASLFWGAAAVLRLLLVAWAPLVLMTQNASQIAQLTLSLAVGVVIGSLLAPRLIPMHRLRRARLSAYLMGVGILILSYVSHLWSAHLALLAIGVTGGLFMVPINAALQDAGHRTIGSGGAVALQNFFENVAMLATVGIYTIAAAKGAGPVASMLAVGVAVLLATAGVSWHLPGDEKSEASTPSHGSASR